jgi:DNA-binding MarR family transcriptional regulator
MGLVTRQRSARDERQVTVSLTESGVQLRQDAAGVQEQVVRRMGLDESELDQLRHVLRRVTESVALASG